ncbi:MAG: hypothetical protein ACHQ4F_16205 [Candidatus Dormibacteria bacterium]
MATACIDAARRWKDTWERGWPRGDVDVIAALYAPSASRPHEVDPVPERTFSSSNDFHPLMLVDARVWRPAE